MLKSLRTVWYGNEEAAYKEKIQPVVDLQRSQQEIIKTQQERIDSLQATVTEMQGALAKILSD